MVMISCSECFNFFEGAEPVEAVVLDAVKAGWVVTMSPSGLLIGHCPAHADLENIVLAAAAAAVAKKKGDSN